jgi:hypothetical protein
LGDGGGDGGIGGEGADVRMSAAARIVGLVLLHERGYSRRKRVCTKVEKSTFSDVMTHV